MSCVCLWTTSEGQQAQRRQPVHAVYPCPTGILGATLTPAMATGAGGKEGMCRHGFKSCYLSAENGCP